MSSVPPFPPEPGDGSQPYPPQQPYPGQSPYGGPPQYPGQQQYPTGQQPQYRDAQQYPTGQQPYVTGQQPYVTGQQPYATGQQPYATGQQYQVPPSYPPARPPAFSQPGYPRPPRNNAVWLTAVIGAVVVAAAAIGVLVVVTGHRSTGAAAQTTTASAAGTSTTSAAGAPSDTTDFDRFAVESLNIGDCFTIDGSGTVKTAACTAEHTDQIFAILTSRADTADGVVGDAKSQCNDAVNQSRVDMEAVPGDANVAYFFPRAGAFASGDRRIECVVEAPTGVTYNSSYVR
ncbi:hypothetical protein [Nocardia stercoris]|uniref:Septum formation-related domain-containing protein n=1 Tax=Nocardia stercoris TaxID=2483361 RepID=A0A3M2L5R1_9NOCA|nr:hypothetical protein [Nocardia stercoris]RMI32951.1 hypothetical protein EBN03_13675 [Nocardia stercoris]